MKIKLLLAIVLLFGVIGCSQSGNEQEIRETQETSSVGAEVTENESLEGFEDIGEFLQENGDTPIGELMKKQNMSNKQIKQWIDETNAEFKADGLDVTITDKMTFNEMMKLTIEAAFSNMNIGD